MVSSASHHPTTNGWFHHWNGWFQIIPSSNTANKNEELEVEPVLRLPLTLVLGPEEFT